MGQLFINRNSTNEILAEPAQQIGPVSLANAGKGAAPQAPRYTSKSQLTKAKTLEDLWPAIRWASLLCCRNTRH